MHYYGAPQLFAIDLALKLCEDNKNLQDVEEVAKLAAGKWYELTNEERHIYYDKMKSQKEYQEDQIERIHSCATSPYPTFSAMIEFFKVEARKMKGDDKKITFSKFKEFYPCLMQQWNSMEIELKNDLKKRELAARQKKRNQDTAKNNFKALRDFLPDYYDQICAFRKTNIVT